MLGDMFSAKGKLAAFVKRTTITTDSNVFPQATNKLTNVSRIRRKKVWIVCDGQGKMNCIHLDNPIKIIRELGKLRDENLITEEEFNQTKAGLLNQIAQNNEDDA